MNIVVSRNGQQVTGATTDFDGMFKIQVLRANQEYDVSAFTAYYRTNKLQGLSINAKHMAMIEFQMSETDTVVEPVTKNCKSIMHITRTMAADRFISYARSRCVAPNDGAIGSIKRVRTGTTTDIYIDGVKLRGESNLPKAAYQQAQKPIFNGTPAEFESKQDSTKSALPKDTH